uniref:Methyltransferase domain-containing protein n=1 Tax=Rhodosorus marinus TaxID=101924 RepID=A0A7S3E8R0_9RHOD
MMNTANAVLERNAVPDWILRAGIRRLLGQRLEMEKERSRNPEYKWSFMEELRKLDIAVQMDSANEQHYQVPTEFYLLVLGPCLKYSSCYFPNASTTLEEAEEEMLLKTVQRGDLKDGMDVLDLGCGWGSLTLYIAKNYPKCKITSVSNSWTQKKHIDSICNERNYKNVRVETADVNSWTTKSRFDRVFSIEMFEHMKNYEKLMQKVASCLKTNGKLFVHYFCHREYIYHFESDGPSNWMGKYFFSGGTMPSDDTLLYFQKHLAHENTWKVNGNHYSKTLEAWLQLMDTNIDQIRPTLVTAYGQDSAVKFEAYWRTFFMACSELFKYNDGFEWYVVHHVFVKR